MDTWEPVSWDGENSHNHQMFGTVNEYFYTYLAGIRAPTDEGTSVGYKDIHIKPYIPDGLSHAEASVETVRGTVSSKWNREDKKLELAVTIPANTKGQISIPITKFEKPLITEKGTKIWDDDVFQKDAEAITGGIQENHYVTFEVESGIYNFTVAESK